MIIKRDALKIILKESFLALQLQKKTSERNDNPLQKLSVVDFLEKPYNYICLKFEESDVNILKGTEVL